MGEKLIMDMVEKGDMTKEELKQFMDSIVVYKLDRGKIRTIDNLLDIFEWLAGEMTIEKGVPESLFLQAPLSKYYKKVMHGEEETEESDESKTGA
jgi:hypothetical protein